MATRWNKQSVLAVGVGSIGRRHVRVLRELGIKDIWICDPMDARRQSCREEGPVAREFDAFDAALAAGPDAAILCVPTAMHIAMAINALNAGVHVLCEKPLSDSLARVDELTGAIKRSNKVFAVAFCFRFHEGLTRLRSLIESGAIGRLVSIRCFVGENILDVMPPEQRGHYLTGSGAFELVHEIDLACWLAGEPVTDVQAICGACSDVGGTAPDLVEINVRFGDRCIGNIHLDFFCTPRTRVTEVRGTRGTLAIEFASWDRCTLSAYDASASAWSHEEIPTERDFMFRSEDEEFLRAAAEGTPVTCPLSEAMKSQQVLAQAICGNGG